MRTGLQTAGRVERAWVQMSGCALCEHRCGADRLAGTRGPCKAGVEARVFKERVEYGEEAPLSPSHLFYVSGCDLRCAFCIAEANAFDPRRGWVLTPESFLAAVSRRAEETARTLQWVGGEPTIHLPSILRAMEGCPGLPPVVWKSDFHMTTEALELLDGLVEWYVPDFKFGNDACASRIAGVERYLEVVTRNLLQAQRQGNVIVRHLLLPGHFECCTERIVRWLAERMPDVPFSVRGSYWPRWRAKGLGELAGRVPESDTRRAFELARIFGLRVIE